MQSLGILLVEAVDLENKAIDLLNVAHRDIGSVAQLGPMLSCLGPMTKDVDHIKYVRTGPKCPFFGYLWLPLGFQGCVHAFKLP